MVIEIEVLWLCIGLLCIAELQLFTIEWIPAKPDFYRSPEWRALRQRVFRAYGYECMRCGIIHPGMNIDHIYPRSLFPDLELDFNNMQVLCRPHNLEKSNTDFTDYRGSRQSERPLTERE